MQYLCILGVLSACIWVIIVAPHTHRHHTHLPSHLHTHRRTRTFSYQLGVVFIYLRLFHRVLTASSDLPGMYSVKVCASNFHGIILPRYGSTMFRKIWSCLSDQARETRVPDFSTLHSRPPTPPVPGYPRASPTPPVPGHPQTSMVDVAKAGCFWYAEQRLQNDMTPRF